MVPIFQCIVNDGWGNKNSQKYLSCVEVDDQRDQQACYKDRPGYVGYFLISHHVSNQVVSNLSISRGEFLKICLLPLHPIRIVIIMIKRVIKARLKKSGMKFRSK